jgi:hypothetical protein
MDSDDLTPSQAERVREALIPLVRYLYRLKRRMEDREFSGGDALYLLTEAAYGAAGDLVEKLHAMTVENGVPKAKPTVRDEHLPMTLFERAERARREKGEA